MAKTNEHREPGEKDTINIGSVEDISINDPLTSANPTDKEYTRYKADIITGVAGDIPDIPEPAQQNITVDFTKNSGDSDPDFSGIDHGAGMSDGEGTAAAPGEEQEKSDSRVDFTQNEKFLMAKVITGMSMEGLAVLNDFIINKWMITEEQVRDRILEGEADPGVLAYQITMGDGSVIDIKQILTGNREAVEKALTFDKEEQKRFTELLALILKDNNAELKPEWMIVVMLIQKYGIGIYTINKVNQDTKNLLDRVNYLIETNRRQHNMGGADVTIEQSRSEPQNHATKPVGKARKVKNPLSKPKNGKTTASRTSHKTEVDESTGLSDAVEEAIGDMRETGETKAPRRAKRSVNKSLLSQVAEDVSYTKVRD